MICRHLTSIECGDAVTHCLGHYHHPTLLQLPGFWAPMWEDKSPGNPILPGTLGAWSTNASWKGLKKLGKVAVYDHLADTKQRSSRKYGILQSLSDPICSRFLFFSGCLWGLWNWLLFWIFPFLLLPSQRKFLSKFSSLIRKTFRRSEFPKGLLKIALLAIMLMLKSSGSKPASRPETALAKHEPCLC